MKNNHGRRKFALRTWVFGMYLMETNLKSVSLMRLYRDLGLSRLAAWIMAWLVSEAMSLEVGQTTPRALVMRNRRIKRHNA